MCRRRRRRKRKRRRIMVSPGVRPASATQLLLGQVQIRLLPGKQKDEKVPKKRCPRD
jgi:hypothetical protein